MAVGDKAMADSELLAADKIVAENLAKQDLEQFEATKNDSALAASIAIDESRLAIGLDHLVDDRSIARLRSNHTS